MPVPLLRDWCSRRMLLLDKMHPCGFKICWRHLSYVYCSFPVMLGVLWELINMTEMVDYFRCIQLFSAPTSLYNIAHTCVHQQHVKDHPRAILPIFSLSLKAWMASSHKENCYIYASCDMRSHGVWTQLPQGWYKKGLYCCHNNSLGKPLTPHRSSVERILANFRFRNLSSATSTEDEYFHQDNPAASIWG